MKNIKYIHLLFIPLLSIALLSCKKETYDPNPAEAHLTWVKNVKMVLNGVEIQGKINEGKKEIIFPKVAANANLSAISFKGELPNGAKFENEKYDFTPDEGNSFTKKSIKIVNNNRFREYFVTINLSVPPVGAGFAQAKVYNFSASGTKYPSFSTATSARVADMDLTHVLVVGRDLEPHLLLLSDLKKGVISPIAMSQTGVAGGGGSSRNAGRLINGNAYISNLTTAFNTGSNPVKVYHWKTSAPELPPTVVAEYRRADVPGQNDAQTDRYGDMTSIDLDANGNGYIFVKGNNLSSFLRIKVTNFTSTSEPTIISPGTSLGGWAAYNEVEGAKGSYLYTGHQGPLRLCDAGGAIAYTLPATTLANVDGVGARIITFNGARYLIAVNNILLGATIAVYDLTKGGSTQEALEIFNNADALGKAPVYTFALGASLPSGNAAVQISWVKDGNNKLYIIGSGVEAGFAIVEFPQATETDPFDNFVVD